MSRIVLNTGVPSNEGQFLQHGRDGENLELVPSWYAIQTKRHEERRVVRHLALRAIPSLLPFIEVVRRYGGRRVARVEPLFPGYLFVQLSPWEVNPAGWSAVQWSPGVRRILGTEEVPVPVPDETIATIKTRMSDFGFIRPGPRFVSGSQVRFRHGPLVGLEAIFEGPMSREGRVRVLLELLGQPRLIEVDEVDLETA